jgi:hypothetical protein
MNTIGISPREAFLAAAIAAMVGCGILSFLLSGRAAARTHVALAMLAVLIGGFALLVLFGAVGERVPLAGVAILVGLIALFKLMSQFEIRRKTAAAASEPARSGPQE